MCIQAMFNATRSTANNIAILTGFEKLYFQYDNIRYVNTYVVIVGHINNLSLIFVATPRRGIE